MSQCEHKTLNKQLSGMQVWYVCGDGWISVEDSLPEKGHVVLIFDSNEQVVEMAWRVVEPFDEKVWTWYLDRTAPQDELIIYPPERVSHWRELPNPPSGRECGQKFKAEIWDGKVRVKRAEWVQEVGQ